jgi:ferredoxin
MNEKIRELAKRAGFAYEPTVVSYTHPVKEQDQTCHADGSQCGVGGYCGLCKFSIESQELDWSDRDDEWTNEIKAAHPLNTGFHNTYALACEMVGNRNSKFALVALVNWLLRKAQEK